MTWFLCILTALYLYLMGEKSIWGPILAVIAQMGWLYYIFKTNDKGLIVGRIIILIMAIWTLYKWW